MANWVNNHPKTMAVIGGICFVTVVGVIVAEVLASRHVIVTAPPYHYYTVDDGKTFFKESQSNIPPFDYKGQTAVRACVFSCGDHLFVGYLERYTPEARQKELGSGRGSAEVEVNGRELKHPGDSTWVSSSDKTAMIKATHVVCPDGSSETPMPVEP